MPNVNSLAKWFDGPTPPERYKLRPLSGDARAAAKRIRSDEAQIQALKVLAVIDASAFDNVASERKEPDPANPDLYDDATVIKAGVVEWEGVDLTDPVKELDPETYDWAKREIIAMSVRPGPEAKGSTPTL